MMIRDVRIRVASVALGLAVALGSMAPAQRAEASGVPVIDIAAITKTIQDFFETKGQWVTENFARAQQYNLLLKNLVRFGQKLQNFNLSPGMKLDPIDPLQGVSQKCGTGFSLNPSGFANMLGLGGESPRVRAQKLCGAIQYMKNTRYNYLVDTLNDILPDISKSLMDLFSLLSSLSSDPGDNAAVQTQLADASNKLQAASMEMESQLQAYDSIIKSLEDQQRITTEQQLRGTGTVLGSVVTNVALSKVLDDAAED